MKSTAVPQNPYWSVLAAIAQPSCKDWFWQTPLPPPGKDHLFQDLWGWDCTSILTLLMAVLMLWVLSDGCQHHSNCYHSALFWFSLSTLDTSGRDLLHLTNFWRGNCRSWVIWYFVVGYSTVHSRWPMPVDTKISFWCSSTKSSIVIWVMDSICHVSDTNI